MPENYDAVLKELQYIRGKVDEIDKHIGKSNERYILLEGKINNAEKQIKKIEDGLEGNITKGDTFEYFWGKEWDKMKSKLYFEFRATAVIISTILSAIGFYVGYLTK